MQQEARKQKSLIYYSREASGVNIKAEEAYGVKVQGQ
jgi:hypothetical protein